MKIIILTSILLSACALSSPTYSPSGAKAYSLSCSGPAGSWGTCYKNAGNICKEKGYKVITGGEQAGIAIMDTDGHAAVLNPNPNKNIRNLVVECKP